VPPSDADATTSTPTEGLKSARDCMYIGGGALLVIILIILLILLL
jgi:hypothetical protein